MKQELYANMCSHLFAGSPRALAVGGCHMDGKEYTFEGYEPQVFIDEEALEVVNLYPEKQAVEVE